MTELFTTFPHGINQVERMFKLTRQPDIHGMQVIVGLQRDFPRNYVIFDNFSSIEYINNEDHKQYYIEYVLNPVILEHRQCSASCHFSWSDVGHVNEFSEAFPSLWVKACVLFVAKFKFGIDISEYLKRIEFNLWYQSFGNINHNMLQRAFDYANGLGSNPGGGCGFTWDRTPINFRVWETYFSSRVNELSEELRQACKDFVNWLYGTTIPELIPIEPEESIEPILLNYDIVLNYAKESWLNGNLQAVLAQGYSEFRDKVMYVHELPHPVQELPVVDVFGVLLDDLPLDKRSLPIYDLITQGYIIFPDEDVERVIALQKLHDAACFLDSRGMHYNGLYDVLSSNDDPLRFVGSL